MIRNLKVLGLALVAVFAMSAMAASGASAQQGVFTADGPSTGDGTEIVAAGDTNAFFYPGLSGVECEGSTYDVEGIGGGLVASGAKEFTVTPAYNNPKCKTIEGIKATVTMNGCDFVFHIGSTTEAANTYGVTADVVCPAGKSIDVEVYASTTSEAVKTCTLLVGPQTGLTGAHLTNNGTDITLTGTFNGIKASKSGLCSASETTTASYQTAVTVTGTDSKGAATNISITD